MAEVVDVKHPPSGDAASNYLVIDSRSPSALVLCFQERPLAPLTHPQGHEVGAPLRRPREIGQAGGLVLLSHAAQQRILHQTVAWLPHDLVRGVPLPLSRWRPDLKRMQSYGRHPDTLRGVAGP
jgi:hypothetical protein